MLFLAAVSLFGHHSTSAYDQEHLTSMTGTVTEFEWANPHAQVHLNVIMPNGQMENWSAETAPPNMLHRAGWTKETLKPGDKITVTGHIAKDGRKIIRVEKFIMPDGKELSQRTD